MQYIFLAPDGSEYGPVDIATLRQWGQEGRILPHNQIRVLDTGKIVPASVLMDFPSQAPPPPGSGAFTPYVGSQMYGGGANELRQAWMYFAAGILCCPIFGLLGAVYGYNAMRKGHPNGMLAMIANLIALFLTILLFNAARGMLSGLGG